MPTSLGGAILTFALPFQKRVWRLIAVARGRAQSSPALTDSGSDRGSHQHPSARTLRRARRVPRDCLIRSIRLIPMIPISRLIGMMPLDRVIPFAIDWCAFEGSGWNDHEAVARAYGDLRTDASSLAQGRTARAGAPRLRPRLAGSQGLGTASRRRHPSLQGTEEPAVHQSRPFERRDGAAARVQRRSG